MYPYKLEHLVKSVTNFLLPKMDTKDSNMKYII